MREHRLQAIDPLTVAASSGKKQILLYLGCAQHPVLPPDAWDAPASVPQASRATPPGTLALSGPQGSSALTPVSTTGTPFLSTSSPTPGSQKPTTRASKEAVCS